MSASKAEAEMKEPRICGALVVRRASDEILRRSGLKTVA